jgi:hypothetical protein
MLGRARLSTAPAGHDLRLSFSRPSGRHHSAWRRHRTPVAQASRSRSKKDGDPGQSSDGTTSASFVVTDRVQGSSISVPATEALVTAYEEKQLHCRWQWPAIHAQLPTQCQVQVWAPKRTTYDSETCPEHRAAWARSDVHSRPPKQAAAKVVIKGESPCPVTCCSCSFLAESLSNIATFRRSRGMIYYSNSWHLECLAPKERHEYADQLQLGRPFVTLTTLHARIQEKPRCHRDAGPALL